VTDILSSLIAGIEKTWPAGFVLLVFGLLSYFLPLHFPIETEPLAEFRGYGMVAGIFGFAMLCGKLAASIVAVFDSISKRVVENKKKFLEEKRLQDAQVAQDYITKKYVNSLEVIDLRFLWGLCVKYGGEPFALPYSNNLQVLCDYGILRRLASATRQGIWIINPAVIKMGPEIEKALSQITSDATSQQIMVFNKRWTSDS